MKSKFGEGGLANQVDRVHVLSHSHVVQPLHPLSHNHLNSKKKFTKLLMGNVIDLVLTSLTQTLTSVSNSLVQTWKEAKIAEKVESGMNSVKATLTDPNLQEEVKQKAQAGWSWLSSSAASLWNVAKATASSIVSEFSEPQPETQSNHDK